MQKYSLLFLLFLMGQSLLAQYEGWHPIPFGQTSYFMDAQSGEILSMECDGYTPGGAGEFFEINRQRMLEEFDSCASLVWFSDFQPNPSSDFYGFVRHPGQLSLTAKDHQFFFPLNEAPGTWSYFGNDLLLRYDGIAAFSVFGSMDSVRSFGIYESDSFTLIGSIELSKFHGLTSFTSFKVLDGVSNDTGKIWELVGYQDSIQAAGFALPGKTEYFPYSIGDELVLRYSGWNLVGPNIWEQFKDFISLEITSLDTHSLTIYGLAHRYDSLGFFMETDSNFRFELGLLEAMIDHPVSVPDVVEIIYPAPFFDSSPNTWGWISSYPEWYDDGPLGVVAELGGYEMSHCDSGVVVDGLSHYLHASSEVGFLFSHLGSFGMAPIEYELVSADGLNFSYGEAPTWLSVRDELKAEDLKLFPNPASSEFTITWADGLIMELSMFDLAGNEIMAEQVAHGQKVDISTWSPGLYFYQVSTDLQTEVGRIVVK